MILVGEEEMEDIATGAAVLGAGGGGDPYIGKLMAVNAIRQFGKVKLISASELRDDDLVIPTAMMGAPTVMVEKIPSGGEVEAVYRSLESILGRSAAATMPVEAGGLNSTIPFTLAAKLRIPVVDADGMGRAFPEVQMETFGLYGVKATPMTMCDDKGNQVTIKSVSNLVAERLSRAVTVVMGGSAIIGVYPMSGKEVKESSIEGTISLARRIGVLIRSYRENGRSAVDAVVSESHGKLIFTGKLIDVERRTVAGFSRGKAELDGFDAFRGSRMTIEFQNENLIARVDGSVVASVPDLISILDSETGLPITTEGLRYGFRVAVVGLPCSDKWRTPEGLKVVGPRYFGYDIEYRPIDVRT